MSNKVKIEITHDQLEDIVRKELQLSYYDVLAAQDTKMMKRIRRVLKYYSTPQQYKDFMKEAHP